MTHQMNEVPANRYQGPIMPAIDEFGNRSFSGSHPLEDVKRYGEMRDAVKELMREEATTEHGKWTLAAAWVFIYTQRFGKEPTKNQSKPIWI